MLCTWAVTQRQSREVKLKLTLHPEHSQLCLGMEGVADQRLLLQYLGTAGHVIKQVLNYQEICLEQGVPSVFRIFKF